MVTDRGLVKVLDFGLARYAPAVGDETEWHVVAGGQLLARLREPEPEDMFWFSFQIVPASRRIRG